MKVGGCSKIDAVLCRERRDTQIKEKTDRY